MQRIVSLTYFSELNVSVYNMGPIIALHNHCVAGVNVLRHEEELWGLNVDKQRFSTDYFSMTYMCTSETMFCQRN